MHTTQFEKENEWFSSGIKRLIYYFFFKSHILLSLASSDF